MLHIAEVLLTAFSGFVPFLGTWYWSHILSVLEFTIISYAAIYPYFYIHKSNTTELVGVSFGWLVGCFGVGFFV